MCQKRPFGYKKIAKIALPLGERDTPPPTPSPRSVALHPRFGPSPPPPRLKNPGYSSADCRGDGLAWMAFELEEVYRLFVRPMKTECADWLKVFLRHATRCLVSSMADRSLSIGLSIMTNCIVILDGCTKRKHGHHAWAPAAERASLD